MKHDIRTRILNERQSLTKTAKRRLDADLNNCLEETFDWLEIQSPAKILAFHPHSEKNEADIVPFLDYLFEEGHEIYFVRIKDDHLETAKVTTLEDLEAGKLGIKEPKLIIDADNHMSFDLILVPGVAFSEDCHRIGYGKGFYDKLLANIRGLKLGIGYDFQVVPKIPQEEHDVQLDMVITEKSIYRI
jgi:5-formyltetrahydrofolate cyclo-ligase